MLVNTDFYGLFDNSRFQKKASVPLSVLRNIFNSEKDKCAYISNSNFFIKQMISILFLSALQ